MSKKGDTLEHIKENNILQLTQELLDKVIVSTDALKQKKMTPERMKEYRLTLGYVNAVNTSIKTKLIYFRMTDLDLKLAAVKESSGKRWGDKFRDNKKK